MRLVFPSINERTNTSERVSRHSFFFLFFLLLCLVYLSLLVLVDILCPWNIACIFSFDSIKIFSYWKSICLPRQFLRLLLFFTTSEIESIDVSSYGNRCSHQYLSFCLTFLSDRWQAKKRNSIPADSVSSHTIQRNVVLIVVYLFQMRRRRHMCLFMVGLVYS